MSNKLHNELRKEFQLERMILFSDAVFAIAITLLVIEIKIPELKQGEILTEHLLLQKLAHLIPKFIGFIISFLLIGQYWIVHHRMFGFVINFSDKLIWLNLLFLLATVLMPFSTGYYSEYVGRGVVSPVIFYTANICLLGLSNFLMWRYLSNPKNNLTENLTPPLAKYFSLRALTVPTIFVIFSFVYLYSPLIAVWIPISIPIILRLIFNPMKKKL
ncbi:MAG TPA: TMEM175 family protein [Chitinophagaceae bacterium]|nr:TMEM175 family protein [Chitinophagaceae bacterium]